MTGVKSKQEKRINIIAHFLMTILSILAIAPFWMMVSSSLTDNDSLTKTGYNFWPQVFSMDAYHYIMTEWGQIGHSYFNSILVTVTGTVISLLMVSLAGTALSQKGVPGLKFIFIVILVTMLFNGGVVSSYITYSQIFKIKNTIFALIVPNLLLSGFNIILVKNYIQNTIPMELHEAAEIDGAGLIRIYATIILPLSKPILATVGLLVAVGYWNDWTNGLYFINDSKLNTVQLLLNQMNNNVQYLASHSELGLTLGNIPTVSVRMAIAVVGILPIVVLYPFFQKYFEQGITVGAVKG